MVDAVPDPRVERPSFEIDDPSLMRLRILRDNIHEDPATYLSALSLLHTDAPAYAAEESDNPARAVATQQLQELVTGSDLIHMEFDATTQQKFDQNVAIRGLAREIKKYPGQKFRENGIWKREDDPRAVDLRNQVRIRTLGIYISEVLDWNNQHAASADSPDMRSAG
jgi:hypothetical protein